MKYWKATLIAAIFTFVQAVAAFKVRDPNWFIYAFVGTIVFVIAALLKGFADDKEHRADPNWVTMKDSIILLILWKLFR